MMYPHEWPLEIGGVYGVGIIADQQVGPTCAFEAVENVAELYHGWRADGLSDFLISFAQSRGQTIWTEQGVSLRPDAIQPVLARLQIPATWYEFDQQILTDALHNDQVGLLIVDAYFLDRRTYPTPGSWHAITITNYITDPAVSVVEGFRGIDSNAKVRRTHNWRAEHLQRAVDAAIPVFGATLLLTDHPVRWNQQGCFFKRTAGGSLVAVRSR